MLLEKFTPFVRQYIVITTANLSLVTLGIDLLWTSPVLIKLRDQENPVLSRPITDLEASWIVTISFISTIIANFLAAYLQDHLGRKFCIVLSNIPRLLCYLILIFAQAPWTVIVARFLSGCGNGFIYSVLPTYSSEISSKEIRGKLGAIQPLLTQFGSLFILSAGPYLEYYLLNIIIFFICLVTSLPLMFLPDSPYFLFAKGRKDESTKILEFLRGSAALAKEEIVDYESSVNNKEHIDLREVFKSRIFLKTLIIIMLFGFIFQFNGYIATQVFLQIIVQSTHTNIQPELVSVIIGIIQLFASMLAIHFNDKFNRKPIMYVSLITLSLGMAGLGGFFWCADNKEEVIGYMNALPLISLILIFVGYGAGIGGVIYLIISEVFQGPGRAIGVASAILTSSMSAFLVSWFLFPMISLVGSAVTFWIFSGNSLILCIYIALFIPETKGKSFAEIQVALGSKTKESDVYEFIIP